jgi:glycosyltransferase involved in cell wall biosynthesis
MRDLASEFDVAIAPLADTAFNRLKSDIKLLEYTAMGLPAVVSAIGPYLDADWVDRCSSPDDWGRALSELINDRFVVEEKRVHVEAQEEEMWRGRRAAVTGEFLMSRIIALLDR